MNKIQPPILESVPSELLETNFPSVSDRYYEHKYCRKFSTSEDNFDHRVSFHTNRVCMISLSEKHPVMKNKKLIRSINCNVDDKTNRLVNNTSGKGKRGAQKLTTNSILCYIECEDNSSYPVYSCVKGKLLEINENLIKCPQLMVEKPVSEGFIALILPNLNEYLNLKSEMLTTKEYFNICCD